MTSIKSFKANQPEELADLIDLIELCQSILFIYRNQPDVSFSFFFYQQANFSKHI